MRNDSNYNNRRLLTVLLSRKKQNLIAFICFAFLGLFGGGVYGSFFQNIEYVSTASITVLDKNDTTQSALYNGQKMTPILREYLYDDEAILEISKVFTGDENELLKAKYGFENGFYHPEFKNDRGDYLSNKIGKYYSVNVREVDRNVGSIYVDVKSVSKDEAFSKDLSNSVVFAAKILADTEGTTIHNLLQNYVNPNFAETANSTEKAKSFFWVVGLLLGGAIGAVAVLAFDSLSPAPDIEKITL